MAHQGSKVLAAAAVASVAIALGIAVGFLAGKGDTIPAAGTAAGLGVIAIASFVFFYRDMHKYARVDVEKGSGEGGMLSSMRGEAKGQNKSTSKKNSKEGGQAALELATAFAEECQDWLEMTELTAKTLATVQTKITKKPTGTPRKGLAVKTQLSPVASPTLKRGYTMTKRKTQILIEKNLPPSPTLMRTPTIQSGRRGSFFSKGRRASFEAEPLLKDVPLRNSAVLPGLSAAPSGRTIVQGVAMSENMKGNATDWNQLLSSFHSAVYVASLTDYKEPKKLNRSIKLFQRVYLSHKMNAIPIVLLLNRVDDFETMLKEKPLSEVFTFYNGGNSAVEAMDFIRCQFEEAVLNEESERTFVSVVGDIARDASFQSMMNQIFGQRFNEGALKLLVLGTSGSGKSSFCDQLQRYYSSIAAVDAEEQSQQENFKSINIVEGSIAKKEQWAELILSIQNAIYVAGLDADCGGNLKHTIELFRRVYLSPKMAAIPIVLVLNRFPSFDRGLEKAQLTRDGDTITDPDEAVDYIRQQFEVSILGSVNNTTRQLNIVIGNVTDHHFVGSIVNMLRRSAANDFSADPKRARTLMLGMNGSGKSKLSSMLQEQDRQVETTSMNQEKQLESFDVVAVMEGATDSREAWELLVAHAKTSVFLVSLMLYQDPKALNKTIALYEKVFHSAKMAHVPTMVIFTMKDLAAEAIKGKPLKSFFKGYDKANNIENLIGIFAQKFQTAAKSKPAYKSFSYVACTLKNDDDFKDLLSKHIHRALSGYHKQAELRKALILGPKGSGKATFSKQLRKHLQGVITDVASEHLQSQLFDVNEVKEDSFASRKIWEHMIEGASSAVFLCPLTLYKDPGHLRRTLELFRKICRSSRLKDKHLVLLFTKTDLIEEEIQNVSISDVWTDYKEDNNIQNLILYMHDKFEGVAKLESGNREFTIGSGSLADTQQFKTMVQQTLESVIRKYRYREQILKTLVLGPRQSGKSTFSRMLKLYYSDYEPQCTSNLLTEIALDADVVQQNTKAGRNTWQSMIDGSQNAVFVVSLLDYVTPHKLTEEVSLFGRVFHSKKLEHLPLTLILTGAKEFKASLLTSPLNYFFQTLALGSDASIEDSIDFIEKMFLREARLRPSKRIFKSVHGDLDDVESFKKITEGSLGNVNAAPQGRNRYAVLVLGSDEIGKSLFTKQLGIVYKQKAATSSAAQQYEMCEPVEIVEGALAARGVWQNMMNEVRFAAYIYSLPEFSDEDAMQQAIVMFNKVYDSRKMDKISLVLILAGVEAFKLKLKSTRLASIYPTYLGDDDDIDASLEFVKMLFKSDTANRQRTFFSIGGETSTSSSCHQLVKECFSCFGEQMSDSKKILILGPESTSKREFSKHLKERTKSATEQQQDDIENDDDEEQIIRRKSEWEYVVSQVSSLTFVTSLISYQHPAKFLKQLQIFKKICRSKRIVHAKIFLILDDFDALSEQIKETPIERYHPEYVGGPNAAAAADFLRLLFERSALTGTERQVHVMKGTFNSESGLTTLKDILLAEHDIGEKMILISSDIPTQATYSKSLRDQGMKMVDIAAEINENIMEIDDSNMPTKTKAHWKEIVSGLDMVFFLSALNLYTQPEELEKSIALFAKIYNSRKLDGIPIVLVLNKADVMEERLRESPLKKFHPDFKGGSNLIEAIEYIAGLYQNRIEKGSKRDFQFVHGTVMSDSSFKQMIMMSSVMKELTKNTTRQLRALVLGYENSGKGEFTRRLSSHFALIKVRDAAKAQHLAFTDVVSIEDDAHASRESWQKMLTESSTAVFIASAIEYSNQANIVNSLRLFRMILKSKKLENMKVIFVLSKVDAVRGHMEMNPLSRYFTEYKGGLDENAAVSFITDKYMDVIKYSGRDIDIVKLNLQDEASFKSSLGPSLSNAQADVGKILVLGGSGSGKSTFSEQLKNHFPSSLSHETTQTMQDTIFSFTEVETGSKASRSQWSALLEQAELVIFMVPFTIKENASKLNRALTLFSKVYHSQKLVSKDILLLITKVEAGDDVTGMESMFRGIGSLKETTREFNSLSGSILDPNFITSVTTHSLWKSLSDKKSVVMLGPDGSGKSTFTKVIQEHRNQGDVSCPVFHSTGQDEQETIFEAKEVQEGSVASRGALQELIVNAKIVIFVVSLEDCTIPAKLEHSILMFSKVLNSPKLTQCSVCLIFNKKDRLGTIIGEVPTIMRETFSDYNGNADIDSALDYIKSKFENIGREHTMAIGNSLSTESINAMIKESIDPLKKSNEGIEKVLVLGPRGSGKSTFSSCLSQMSKSYSSMDATNDMMQTAGLITEDINKGQIASKGVWQQKIDRAHAVIFFVSLADYPYQSKFEQSKKLFSLVYHSPKLADVPVVLVLNKEDIFMEKIDGLPLSTVFANYNRPDDFSSGLEYINSQFEAIAEGSTHKKFRSTVTCLLNEWSFKSLVYHAIEEPIISKNHDLSYDNLQLMVLGVGGSGKSTFTRLLKTYYCTMKGNEASEEVQETLFEAADIQEGRKESREHWEGLMQRARNAVYIVSLLCYRSREELDKSFSLLRKIASSDKLSSLPMTIILNDYSSFISMIAQDPLKNYYPEAAIDIGDEDASFAFIKSKFSDLAPSSNLLFGDQHAIICRGGLYFFLLFLFSSLLLVLQQWRFLRGCLSRISEHISTSLLC